MGWKCEYCDKVFDIPLNIAGKIGVKKSMWNDKFSAFVQW